MKKIFFLFLTAILSFTLSAQPGAGGPRSHTEAKSLHSKVLNSDVPYNIYLPPSYQIEKDKKYPILYLFHGIGGTNKDWFERGHLKDVMDQLIAGGEVCEMIVVSPKAGGRISEEWNGYFNMPGWNYETFFFTEFVPHIENTHRVIGDKANRAIAGLSMGGGGATSYAQRYPDMFSSLYAMSALMSLPNHDRAASSDPNDKRSLLNESVIKNSCVDYVKNADENIKNQLLTINWYVDCGDDDFLIDRNIEFYQAMREARLPLQFRVRDGGHTWEYWHSALYICLPFVSRNFGK